MKKVTQRPFFPRGLYEILPYAYLVTGALTILVTHTLVGAFWGLLLYSLGALVWILRSHYRRRDRRRTNRRHRWFIPVSLYESLPFAYIATALVLIPLVPSVEALTVGIIFTLLGLQRLMLRVKHRQHSWLMFA